MNRLANLSTENQLRYDLLLAENAAIRSDFRTLQSVCKKLDPTPSRSLNFPEDKSIFSVRLSELRAIFMHSPVGEAIVAADHLLGRIPNAPSDILIEAHLIALQIARAADLKPVAKKFQTAFKQVCASIEPANLDSRSINRLLHAQALHAHLDFLFAKQGDEMNEAYNEWLNLNQTISDDQVWATYFLDRLQVGTQRGLIEWKEDDLRLAAASIRRKRRSVAREKLQSAGTHLAAGNHQSSLESVYQAMDASIEENSWATWTEARSLLALLWLADNLNVRAANAYIHDGAFTTDKSFLKDLGSRLTETEVAEVVDLVVVQTLSAGRLLRACALLISLVEKIDIRSRLKILDFTDQALLESAETMAQALASREVASLIGKFFKCPSDEEASRELKILVKLLKSGPFETRRESLQMLRGAFCSATGPTLPIHELESLLKELDSLFSVDDSFNEETDCGIDIVTSFIRNHPRAHSLGQLAVEFIRKHGADTDTESALALSSSPVSKAAVLKALNAALRVLGRRIQRLPDGSVQTTLFGDSVNEIIPFLPHLSTEQISELYEAMLKTGFDPEADAHLRGQVFEFIKNRIFQQLPTAKLAKGVELFYQRLEGRHAENVFDRSHREANSSIFSGLHVSGELPLRIQRDALIALAAFQGNPSIRDIERYAELLGQLAFAPAVITRVSVGKSIKVYFECCDVSDPLLSPILVRLISDSDDEVASSGIIPAAEELEATGNLDLLTFRLLEATYRSKPELLRRKALAIFCRLAITSNYRGDHRSEILRWHRALSEDRNPLVRKYADTSFWKIGRGAR